MPSRPAKTGYARLAQADTYSDSDSEHEDGGDIGRTISQSSYAPIQPGMRQGMQRSGNSGTVTPNSTTGRSKLPPGMRRARSNSGIDIKAINARLERWADEIASKFKRKPQRRKVEDEQLEIHHSVFVPPEGVRPVTAEGLATPADGGHRMTKLEYDDIVESVRLAIELGVHPKLISKGSSGSYFARNSSGKTVAVFKPKDEEPYASRNPKWTKWIHRNLFPFAFGRAMLIPNLSYVSEAAAYVLDARLQTNIVPPTEVVSLSSHSFYYDFWDRRAYYRKKKPLPEKPGSFQIFLRGYKDATMFLKEHPWPDVHRGYLWNSEPARSKKKRRRRWRDTCPPGQAVSSDEEDSDDDENTLRPSTADDTSASRRREFWTPNLQSAFREELEKLVILDYIMRNTDRGLDNWMIKINTVTEEAKIVVERPSVKPGADEENGDVGDSLTAEHGQYKSHEPMMASSGTATPTPGNTTFTVSLGAIDNSLSWPWKHPDAWRSYPFGWLFLPVSLIGQPFSEATRNHFLPLLTSKHWWAATRFALRQCFKQDPDFQEKMFARQMAVMKGQAWNVVETLKQPDHGPLELTRRARVYVWDDVVDIPVAVPLRTANASTGNAGNDTRSRSYQTGGHDLIEEEEGDMGTMAPATAGTSAPQPHTTTHDLVDLFDEDPASNRFNFSRQPSASDIRDVENDAEASTTKTTTTNVATAAAAAARSLSPDPFALTGHTPPRRSGTLQRTTSHNPDTARKTSAQRPDAWLARTRTRISLDAPRFVTSPEHHRPRRSSFAARRTNTFLSSFSADEDDGDLGYAAAEDRENSRRAVIVERLEMVKAGKPVFTWC